VITDIPWCKREIRERLRNSRNSIIKEEEFVKGLRDSQRLREKPKIPPSKGFPLKGLRQQQVVA
jgi:hypothetical protein